MIKYLQLPFHFDVPSLQNDLDTLTHEQWLPLILSMNYTGKWTSIALVSKPGEEDQVASGHTDGDILETEALKHCPYFQSVLQTFQCPLLSVRLLKLGAGAEIKPHRDFKLGYEYDNFRIHIPIVTNEQMVFNLGGEKLHLAAGECWYINANSEHAAVNGGSEDRVHLVIDGERNDWSDELFFSLAPREQFGVKKGVQNTETMQRILEELERRNEPVSEDILEVLKRAAKGHSDSSD